MPKVDYKTLEKVEKLLKKVTKLAYPYIYDGRNNPYISFNQLTKLRADAEKLRLEIRDNYTDIKPHYEQRKAKATAKKSAHRGAKKKNI